MFACFFQRFRLLASFVRSFDCFFIDWEFSASIISHIINRPNARREKIPFTIFGMITMKLYYSLLSGFILLLVFSQSPSAHVYDAFNISVKAMQIIVPMVFFFHRSFYSCTFFYTYKSCQKSVLLFVAFSSSD